MSSTSSETLTCSPGELHPRSVLTVLVIGTFLAPLDSSIVNIALPSIASDFGVGLSTVSWITSAYLLTTAALLLSMGRLGDVWGLRRLYVAGLLIFGAGSLACAMSGSIEILILSRVVQAVGASMMFAAGPALVTRAFPSNRRGWALGYISLAVSAGLTTGPALGGFLVGQFGWPSIFLINVPLTIGVAALSWRLLPHECTDGEVFDVPGAIMTAVSLLLFLWGLSSAEAYGFLSVQVILPVALSFAVVGVFIWWERRAAHPVVDLRLFDSPGFSAGVAAATLAYLALFAVTFTMPFWLLRVAGVDSHVAGLLLMTTPITMAVFAPVAGRASDRMGSRGLATVGITVLSAGLLWLSFLGTGGSLLFAGVGLLLVGAGMAVFQTPNTSAILRATPRERAGVGSAFVAEARNVGMAVGVALTAAIVGVALGGEGLPGGTGPVSADVASQFSAGMSMALRVASAVSLGAAALSWYGRGIDTVEAHPAKP